jgi:hypothetical protein
MKLNILFACVVSCLLAISFVGQNKLIYEFLWDNETFIQAHCVNQDKPELQCNGACKIKEIQNDRESEENHAPSKEDYNIPILFFEGLKSEQQLNQNVSKNEQTPWSALYRNPFHFIDNPPPKVV